MSENLIQDTIDIVTERLEKQIDTLEKENFQLKARILQLNDKFQEKLSHYESGIEVTGYIMSGRQLKVDNIPLEVGMTGQKVKALVFKED